MCASQAVDVPSPEKMERVEPLTVEEKLQMANALGASRDFGWLKACFGGWKKVKMANTLGKIYKKSM